MFRANIIEKRVRERARNRTESEGGAHSGLALRSPLPIARNSIGCLFWLTQEPHHATWQRAAAVTVRTTAGALKKTIHSFIRDIPSKD